MFDKHKLSFYVSTTLWLRKYDGFDFSHDLTIEMSVTFWLGPPHADSAS